MKIDEFLDWFKDSSHNQKVTDVQKEIVNEYLLRVELLENYYSDSNAKEKIESDLLQYLYLELITHKNYSKRKALTSLKVFLVIPYKLSQWAWNRLINSVSKGMDNLIDLIIEKR